MTTSDTIPNDPTPDTGPSTPDGGGPPTPPPDSEGKQGSTLKNQKLRATRVALNVLASLSGSFPPMQIAVDILKMIVDITDVTSFNIQQRCDANHLLSNI